MADKPNHWAGCVCARCVYPVVESTGSTVRVNIKENYSRD